MRWREEWELTCADVDDAVAVAALQGQDPTGGRGANGEISKQLDDNNAEDKMLESAV